MQQLIEDATINPLLDYGNNYKIIGMPFYNEEYKKEEFLIEQNAEKVDFIFSYIKQVRDLFRFLHKSKSK